MRPKSKSEDTKKEKKDSPSQTGKYYERVDDGIIGIIGVKDQDNDENSEE